MINVQYGEKTGECGKAYLEMFRDRGVQFCQRYGWDLSVDDSGHEKDEYDLEDPVYIILRNGLGNHVGSTRLMPTTGRTMINEKFPSLLKDLKFNDKQTWEVTRFFISDISQKRIRDAAKIMLAGCQLAMRLGVTNYVGVTSPKLSSAFKVCGWPSEVLAYEARSDGDICVCRWRVTDEVILSLASRIDEDDLLTEAVITSSSHAGVRQFSRAH